MSDQKPKIMKIEEFTPDERLREVGTEEANLAANLPGVDDDQSRIEAERADHADNVADIDEGGRLVGKHLPEVDTEEASVAANMRNIDREQPGIKAEYAGCAQNVGDVGEGARPGLTSAECEEEETDIETLHADHWAERLADPAYY